MNVRTAPAPGGSLRPSGTGWWTPAACLVVAGWGSNQFSPLIVLYKQQLQLSSSVLAGLYGLYALGLLPTLLVGGRLSDRFGRRRIIVPALALGLVATSTLAAADGRTAWLFAGRLLTGLYCGLVLSGGVAWLKERSTESGNDRSSGRATLAITAGFAAGPLVAGVLAQVAPRPQATAYLPHIGLTMATLVAALCADHDAPVAASTGPGDRGEYSAFPLRAFILFFLPYAPWVFATAAVFLAYLTPMVAVDLQGAALVFSAACATVGALAGIAVQPLARVLLRFGFSFLVAGSMALVVAGLLLGAWAASAASPWLVLIDSVVLGGAYGVCQFCGLLKAQQSATPATLGSVIGSYQALTYTGFALPYVLGLVSEHTHLGPPVLLLIAAALATFMALASCLGERRVRDPRAKS